MSFIFVPCAQSFEAPAKSALHNGLPLAIRRRAQAERTSREAAMAQFKLCFIGGRRNRTTNSRQDGGEVTDGLAWSGLAANECPFWESFQSATSLFPDSSETGRQKKAKKSGRKRSGWLRDRNNALSTVMELSVAKERS